LASPQAHRAGIRAEHVRVHAAGTGIAATVVLAEHLGDASILHLRVDGLPELLHAKAGPGHAHLLADAVVGVTPDAAAALAFDAAGVRL